MREHGPDLGPAAVYRHDHPPVRNVLREHQRELTVGQHIADRVAQVVGSWPSIILQSVVLFGWIVVNVWLALYARAHPRALQAWDPYPFILLNLVLSFQAAYTGPIVMMSQNRQAQRDRLLAENDFEINQKAEDEIEVMMRHLAHQDKLVLEAIAHLESLRASPTPEIVATKTEEILKRMDANDRRILILMSRVGAGE